MSHPFYAFLLASGMLVAAPVDWPAVPEKLVAGQRVEIEHQGKFDRGIYSFSNANEIVITTAHNGFLSIPRTEVDRIVLKGTEAPKLSYFGNASDQLFPKRELVYEKSGSTSATGKR